MRDYLKVQHLFARIASEDFAARDKAPDVRPEYYSAMLDRMAMDVVNGTSPVHCDKALIQCLLEQIGAFYDPCTQLLISGKTAWQPEDPGFRVRRCGDRLIVTEAAKDHRFVPGDILTKVQNNPIPEYHRQVWRTLRTKIQENEDWLIALQFSSTVHVQRDGSEERLPLMRFSFDQPDCITEINVTDGVCLMRFDSLSDADGIRQLLLQNASAISQSRGVIVDLRRCSSRRGDCDALLPLLADRAVHRSELIPNEEIYLLYSPGNKQIYRSEIESLLSSAQDEQECAELEALMKEIEGKTGWIPEQIEDDEDPMIQPISCKKLIVLSDRDTGSDAERFIEAVRRSGRGTLLGRNTLGALDYVRPLARPLDSSLTLVYSCGMRAEAFHGNGISGIGLAPDIHIPWTPMFLTGDPDLEAAIRLIHG